MRVNLKLGIDYRDMLQKAAGFSTKHLKKLRSHLLGCLDASRGRHLTVTHLPFV